MEKLLHQTKIDYETIDDLPKSHLGPTGLTLRELREIDYKTKGDVPESQLRLTRRGRLALTLSGVVLGLSSVLAGVGLANQGSETGNSIPLRTAQITMDQPNFTAIAKSLPGYSPESTNLNEVIYEIRQLNPDLDPSKLRPGTQVIVPNLEQ